jgi:hypothetical protein
LLSFFSPCSCESASGRGFVETPPAVSAPIASAGRFLEALSAIRKLAEALRMEPHELMEAEKLSIEPRPFPKAARLLYDCMKLHDDAVLSAPDWAILAHLSVADARRAAHWLTRNPNEGHPYVRRAVGAFKDEDTYALAVQPGGARLAAIERALERMRDYLRSIPGRRARLVWPSTVSADDRLALNALMAARTFEMPGTNTLTAERARLIAIELSSDEEDLLRHAQQAWGRG